MCCSYVVPTKVCTFIDAQQHSYEKNVSYRAITTCENALALTELKAYRLLNNRLLPLFRETLP